MAESLRPSAAASSASPPNVRSHDARSVRVQYADSKKRVQWLSDPVIGDPGFDSFERSRGNPFHRGSAPFEWPVNSYLYRDATSGWLYAYIGEYPAGYIGRAARCLLYTSRDDGRTWQRSGVVLEGDPQNFDGDGKVPGGTPEISIVFEDGRYHIVYDWGTADGSETGLAYAWADKPEGPFHRAAEPLFRRTTQPLIDGRYCRPYGGTLIRRHSDWLIVAGMDYAPHAWALFAASSEAPDGPYSAPVLVRQVERDYYHPPLLEFYPAFSLDGYVYAPATSVARNRDFNVLFRAPLERALEPDGWELYQHGSVWHSEDVEHETYGLWGQTIAGTVAADHRFRVLHTSRDANGLGTVGLASRPWDEPYRDAGFRLSGHRGASLTLLRTAYHAFELSVEMDLRGSGRIVWDYTGPIGPDRPTSDATLHPLSWSRHAGVELDGSSWRIITADDRGVLRELAEGSRPGEGSWLVEVGRDDVGGVRLKLGGVLVWEGNIAVTGGPLGLFVDANSSMFVHSFAISGEGVPGVLSFNYMHALLGAGEVLMQFEERCDPAFRFGSGLSGRGETGRVKWNFWGTAASLWSPRGPEWGTIAAIVDGQEVSEIDLYADTLEPSTVVVSIDGLEPGFHALVVASVKGRFPVDSVDVVGQVADGASAADGINE